MTKAHSQDRTSSEAIAKFWNRYIHAVEKSDVPEYQRRWYVIRAREYVKTNRDTPLRDQNPDYVSRYLEELGRKKHLKDWQFMQIVHALKILFCDVVQSDWAKGNDTIRFVQIRWHHIHENTLQKAVKKATRKAGRKQDRQSASGGFQRSHCRR